MIVTSSSFSAVAHSCQFRSFWHVWSSDEQEDFCGLTIAEGEKLHRTFDVVANRNRNRNRKH